MPQLKRDTDQLTLHNYLLAFKQAIEKTIRLAIFKKLYKGIKVFYSHQSKAPFDF